jgi:drug/metabolite transporter (DMT)-like permease
MSETWQVISGVLVASVVLTVIDRVTRPFNDSMLFGYLGGVAVGFFLAMFLLGTFPLPDGTWGNWWTFVGILFVGLFGMRVLGNIARARRKGDGGSLIVRDQPTDSVKPDDRRGARQT